MPASLQQGLTVASKEIIEQLVQPVDGARQVDGRGIDGKQARADEVRGGVAVDRHDEVIARRGGVRPHLQVRGGREAGPDADLTELVGIQDVARLVLRQHAAGPQVGQLIGDSPEKVGNDEKNEKRNESHGVQLPLVSGCVGIPAE